jgi:hypothetical protein
MNQVFSFGSSFLCGFMCCLILEESIFLMKHPSLILTVAVNSVSASVDSILVFVGEVLCLFLVFGSSFSLSFPFHHSLGYASESTFPYH